MKHKLMAVFLAAWVLLAMPMTASAQELDPQRAGSISVTLTDQNTQTPLTGAELSLYYVATVTLNSNNNLSFAFTDAFADCGCALDDPALSIKLDAFVREHAVPMETQVTDAQGHAAFTDLPLGLYLLQQNNAMPGSAQCTTFLVTVPTSDPTGYTYDVNATPKTDVVRSTSITIKKVWNTDESASATDSVTVQLRKDDIVIATAVLNEQNQWQIVYTNMPESDAYSIVEVDVPKGFVASYSRNGYIFTVTNSAFLIQTGQPVWPIPVLALVGLCLVAVGCAVLRKTGDAHA